MITPGYASLHPGLPLFKPFGLMDQMYRFQYGILHIFRLAHASEGMAPGKGLATFSPLGITCKTKFPNPILKGMSFEKVACPSSFLFSGVYPNVSQESMIWQVTKSDGCGFTRKTLKYNKIKSVAFVEAYR